MIEGSLSLVEHSKNVILVGFFEMPVFSTIQHQIVNQPGKNGAGSHGTSGPWSIQYFLITNDSVPSIAESPSPFVLVVFMSSQGVMMIIFYTCKFIYVGSIAFSNYRKWSSIMCNYFAFFSFNNIVSVGFQLL